MQSRGTYVLGWTCTVQFWLRNRSPLENKISSRWWMQGWGPGTYPLAEVGPVDIDSTLGSRLPRIVQISSSASRR